MDVLGAKQEFRNAMEKLEAEIRDGFRHGFFELCVTCEVIQDGRRRLTIRGGKSFQFIIPGAEARAPKIA
jgi:hypothetical protein